MSRPAWAALLLRLILTGLAVAQQHQRQRFGVEFQDANSNALLLPRYYEAAVPAVARRETGCASGTHSCMRCDVAAHVSAAG